MLLVFMYACSSDDTHQAPAADGDKTSADLPDTPDALRQAELERRAYSLYTLCLPSAKNETELWKTSALIQK